MEQVHPPSTPALETKFLPNTSSPLRSPTPSMMSSPGGSHSGSQRSRSRPRLPAGPRSRQQRPKDVTLPPAATDAPVESESPPAHAQVTRWSSTSSSTGAPSEAASSARSQSQARGPRSIQHAATDAPSEPDSPPAHWSSSSSSAGMHSRAPSESIGPPAYSARASMHYAQQSQPPSVPAPTPAPPPPVPPVPALDPDLAYAFDTLALADYEAPRVLMHSQSHVQLRTGLSARAPSPQPMSAVSMAPRIPPFHPAQPQQGSPQRHQTSTPPPTPPSNPTLGSASPAPSTTPTPAQPALAPAAPIAPKASPAKQPTPLPNIPAVSFEPPPLPNAAAYKPLTLDAAQWTLSSSELQALVSSAIRESATERFIRLLPPHIVHGGAGPGASGSNDGSDDGRAILDRDLEQAEHSRRAAHARWRFEFGRRRMVLQSLNALAGAGDADTSALVAQLAQSAAATDAQAAALVHAHAHEAALAHLRDMHRASALAVALRKLNASYAKRTRELAGARERVGTLEGEIEDAWRVAEEVALEVDRLRAEVEGYRKRERDRLEAGVQTDEVAEVSLQVTSPTDSVDASVEDEGWEEATVDGLSIISQDLTMVSRAQVVDVMGTAVVSQARLTTVDDAAASPPRVQSPTPTFGPPRTPVTASVPPTSAISAMAVEDERTSTHSRSASMPIADRRLSATSQLSRVTAARKRSMRASKASLRMPRGWTRAEGQNQAQTSRGRSRSKSRRRSLSAEPAERPPLPDLPVDVGSSASVRAGSGSEVDVEVDDKDATMSFLDMNMESKAHTDDEGAENVTMENVGQEIIAPPQSPSLVHPYSAGLTTPRPPRPRSPTTPTLLSSYASPRSPTASQSTSSLAPTATLQTSASMRISHTSHGSHGSMGKGKGKAFAHMSAMSLFGHALGTEEDEEGDEVTEMGGLLGRRGNSLDLPATTGSVGRASMLKRSMSDLLRFGKGKGRRRSVPVQSSLGPGAVGVRVNEGTVS